MHEKLFADFIKSFDAGNAASTDDDINRHTDAAWTAFSRLMDAPVNSLEDIAYCLAASQVWEGGFGGSIKSDAAAAAYKSACERIGFNPLEQYRPGSHLAGSRGATDP